MPTRGRAGGCCELERQTIHYCGSDLRVVETAKKGGAAMKNPRSKVEHFNWLRAGKLEEALESIGGAPNLEERLSKVKVLDKTDEEVSLAANAVRKTERGEELSPREEDALEAIVLPAERPVVDVVNDSFGDVEAPFAALGTNAQFRENLETAIKSVGRIGLPSRPDIPFAGTGFVVGDGVLMTNRHVAALFASGLGREELSFQTGQSADIDFTQEVGGREGEAFAIERVLLIHPFWDMALLEVTGLQPKKLGFLTADPADLVDRDVAVIGYPAFDPRNDATLQMRIFRKTFNVKRLQPGRLRPRKTVRSFENQVLALLHDASTLGGNSGSAVVDVETGKVVALHFGGRYLEANFAVPAFELARDGRVFDAGVSFDVARPSQPAAWERRWQEADPSSERTGGSNGAVGPNVPALAGGDGGSTPSTLDGGQTATWTIPLQISVRLAGVGAAVSIGSSDQRTGLNGSADHASGEAFTEKMVEPFHVDNYSARTGYDEEFLGKHVALPHLNRLSLASKLEDGSHVLPYEHFSVVMHKQRRIALLTASNVDGTEKAKRPQKNKPYSRAALSGLGKNDIEKWFTDPRIPALHQLPDKFFTKDRAAFDKGHLVRREDVAWGDSYAELRRANGDTYHVTNCSPQVKGFNRSNLGGLWGALENLVLERARADGDRYSVFAGPILSEDDPRFAGFDDEGKIAVQIPQRFWKVVVATSGNKLQTFAFILDQDLADVNFGQVEERFFVDAEWRGNMVSLATLESELEILTFSKALHDSDQFGAGDGESVRVAGLSRELLS
jgi:endonuclease G, mitochondrial